MNNNFKVTLIANTDCFDLYVPRYHTSGALCFSVEENRDELLHFTILVLDGLQLFQTELWQNKIGEHLIFYLKSLQF